MLLTLQVLKENHEFSSTEPNTGDYRALDGCDCLPYSGYHRCRSSCLAHYLQEQATLPG
jgi:hypothetical protein